MRGKVDSLRETGRKHKRDGTKKSRGEGEREREREGRERRDAFLGELIPGVWNG